jgi:pyruvate ferredoxin oxidoreductase beta subunit
MKNLSIYASRLTPSGEQFSSGHRACIGCAEALAVRQVCKAIGENTIIANATGCMEIVSSQLPNTNWQVPWIHTLFENTAAVASGVDSALKALERKGKRPAKGTKVVAMGGDGATLDIGMQAISGCFERYQNVMYVCYDNEAYMNTGIQRSSATPFGASTTTSPAGKKSFGQRTQKKDMPAIAVAHNIPYVATACPSYPFDLMEKVQRGLAADGPSYIHVLSVCPTGWRCPPDLSVRMGRLAVETGVFPLYEVINGEYKLSYDPSPLRPLKDYTALQGRFRHLSPDMLKEIEAKVARDFKALKERCA